MGPRRIPLVVLAVGVLAGCTEREVGLWLNWHAVDPAAAEAFASTPEIQAELTADDVPAEPEWTAAPTGYRSRWDEIARCESGGRWDYPPVTNRTGTYSGGLMIGHRWWPLFDGTEFAQYPYLASKAEQIVVAERILAENGWRAWDCS